MRIQSKEKEGFQIPPHTGLPAPLDCETNALFRSFLTPILETVQSWQELKSRLSHKGYGIAFREGHLVILKAETGEALCTGRAMGVPLKELSHRLGRPCVKAHTNGLSGELG